MWDFFQIIKSALAFSLSFFLIRGTCLVAEMNTLILELKKNIFIQYAIKAFLFLYAVQDNVTYKCNG